MSMPNVDREIYLNMVATLARGWSQVAGVDPKSFPPLPDEPDEGIVNPPAQSREITPEPDQSVWVGFKQAQAMTGLQAYEITRACKAGKIRYQGNRKGRRVHSGDLSDFMAARN